MDITKKIIFIFSILCLTDGLFITDSRAIYIPKQKEIINQGEFVGSWNMQTIVTDSKCPYVLVGSTTESNLEIKPVQKRNSNIFSGLWNGGKWKISKATIKLLNEREAITERYTEMNTNDNIKWKATLIDHLYLEETNIIHSESIVTQYKNGTPVGNYKTFSILTKIE